MPHCVAAQVAHVNLDDLLYTNHLLGIDHCSPKVCKHLLALDFSLASQSRHVTMQ